MRDVGRKLRACIGILCTLWAILLPVAVEAQTFSPDATLASGIGCGPISPGVAANFKIDGALICSAGLIDWYSTSASCSGLLQTTPPDSVNHPFAGLGPVLFVRDSIGASATTDPTIFRGNSNTNGDLIGDPLLYAGQNPWSYTAGNPPQKDDLSEIYLTVQQDPLTNNLWLIVGGAYISTDGDKHFDFEFNQKGVHLDPARGLVIGDGPAGGRTGGTNPDFVLSIDYQQGGASPCVHIRTWNDTTMTFVEKVKPASCLGDSEFSAVSGANTPVPVPVFGTGVGYDVTDHYDALQFAEAGVNLSCYLPGFNPAAFCGQTSTVTVKTRSSGSSPFEGAQLKDFVIAPFSFVQPPPVALNGPSTVCQGQSAQFCETASPSISHTWSLSSAPPGIANFVAGGGDSSCATVQFSAAGTCTLKVAVTSPDGCVSKTQQIITVGAAAVADAGPDSSACSVNGQFNFVAHGNGSGGTPSWSVISGTANIVSGGATFTPVVHVTGDATLRLTVPGTAPCPPAINDVTFHVDTAPTAAAGADSSACSANGQFNFVAHGSGSNGTPSWQVISGTANIVSGGATFTPFVHVTGDAVLRLTVTGAATCTPATDDVAFHVDTAPTAGAGPDSAVCSVTGVYTFHLVGTGTNGTPAWQVISGNATIQSGGATLTPVVQVTGGPAVLRLTVTGAATCTPATDDVTLQVNTNPTASAGPDSAACSVNGQFNFVAHGSGSGGTASWQVISGTANIISGGATFTPFVHVTGDATLRLTVTSGSGCPPVSDDVSFHVDTAPTAAAGPDSAACSVNGQFNFVAHGSGSGGTPSWQVISGTANIISGGATFTPFVHVTGDATLRLTVTGAATCTPATDDVSFHVNTAPSVAAGPDSSACSSNGEFSFVAHGSGTGTPSWQVISGTANIISGGNTFTPFVHVTGTATLRVTGTGATGCPNSTDDVTFNVFTAPIAAAGPDTSGCFVAGGTLFHLHGTGTNGDCSWQVLSGTVSFIGSQNSCITDVKVSSASATLRLTVTSPHAECGPATDDITLTVTPLPTCLLTRPDPLPVCASLGNQLCATNVTNAATYFWYITSADAGWQITGGQGTSCVQYTAGNGGTGATFHLIVTSDAGCKDSCVVRDSCQSSGSTFCSLTQGAWGNATGKFGNETHLQVEQRVITAANPLVIGIKQSVNAASIGSISFVDGSEDCLIQRMPAGGPARTFPLGLGDQTLTDANGCTAGSLTFNSQGRFNNVLIGQTIALSLNTRLDLNLGGLTLSTTMVSGSVSPGPDGKFGTPDDVCTGTDLKTVYISSRILTAIHNLGLPETVNSLVILCNRALSGLDISPATIGDCNSAASAINEGFDECRCLIQSGTVAENQGATTGGAAHDPFPNGAVEFGLAANSPNPFNHSTLIRFAVPMTAHVRVAVYNILGQQVALLTDRDFDPGVQSLVWNARGDNGAPVAPGVYFTRMRADTATRHFTQTRKMMFVR